MYAMPGCPLMKNCPSCGQPVFIAGGAGEKTKCLRCRSRFLALSRSKDAPFARFTQGDATRVSPFSARTAALLFALLAVAGVLSWLSIRLDKPRSRFEEASSVPASSAPHTAYTGAVPKGLGPVEIIWTRPREKNTSPSSSAPAASSSAASPIPTPVRLVLDSARAKTRSSGDIFFECEATLINTSGAPIQTQTNFSSVFDGISIVIQNDRGDLLHEQAYVYHQSPYAEHQRVDLAAGSTRKKIVFPVAVWDAGTTDELRVHLEGGLWGSAYSKGLVSNELRVRISESKGD